MVAHDLNPLLPVLDSAIYLLDRQPRYAALDDVVDAVLLTQLYDTPIQVTPGDRRPLGALGAELITVTPGQKVAYVVDTLFSPANAAAIVRLAAGADLFFCEAPFLEEDLEQAARRYHLTARQAGSSKSKRSSP